MRRLEQSTSRFPSIGGLRLKNTGRVTKAELMARLEAFLDTLVNEHGIEEFSSVNIYFQMLSGNARQALIGADGEVIQGFEISDILEDPLSFEPGASLCPVATINELEHRRQAPVLHAPEYTAEAQRKRAQEQAQTTESLHTLADRICKEFGVNRIHKVARSHAKVTQRGTILKYIDESQIPEAGFVYRVSLKKPGSQKISSYRIYDDQLNLIAEIDNQ